MGIEQAVGNLRTLFRKMYLTPFLGCSLTLLRPSYADDIQATCTDQRGGVKPNAVINDFDLH